MIRSGYFSGNDAPFMFRDNAKPAKVTPAVTHSVVKLGMGVLTRAVDKTSVNCPDSLNCVPMTKGSCKPPDQNKTQSRQKSSNAGLPKTRRVQITSGNNNACASKYGVTFNGVMERCGRT